MSIVIPIDGPSSSGKSSVGFLFSKKIGFQFIDTGAIYRVGSLVAIRDKVNLKDEQTLTKIFLNLKIHFKTIDDKVHILLNGEDVTDIIHTPEVSNVVPKVASIAGVRKAAKKLQYDVAQNQDTVMAGRDIGSEIFPNAPLKFFITASMEVRAKRRFEQYKRKGEHVTYEQILEDTKKRDEMDEKREASPMRIPEDAIVIDTSDKNIGDMVEELIKYYKKLKL